MTEFLGFFFKESRNQLIYPIVNAMITRYSHFFVNLRTENSAYLDTQKPRGSKTY